MQMRRALVRAFIDRLQQQWRDEHIDSLPSHIHYADGNAIDDGGEYGDPLRDDRPDWVKQYDIPGMTPPRRGNWR